MTMKRTRFAALVASLLVFAGSATAEIKIRPDWAKPEEMDKALEYAKKNNKPVAILYFLNCEDS